MKKRVPAHVREAKLEVWKNQLSKMMMAGTELVKEIQEIKRAPGPKPDNDKEKDKDVKGKGRWGKKGDATKEFTAEENTPTKDAR